MLLNARPFPPDGKNPELILLAIEDITERKQMEAAAEASEVRYRRLFEAAKDGILILNVSSGKIIDANPFMSDLLGYPREYFLDKELWEIGYFKIPGRVKPLSKNYKGAAIFATTTYL